MFAVATVEKDHGRDQCRDVLVMMRQGVRVRAFSGKREEGKKRHDRNMHAAVPLP
jgi:hypothetical protein